MTKLMVKKDEVIFLTLAVFWFVVSLFTCLNVDVSFQNVDTLIYILCWCGIIHLWLTLKSIKNMNEGHLFCLYTIFFIFLFVFSYGQFVMWAFGIHYISEMTVSHHVRFIDKDTVVRIQIISLELLSIFHLGVLISNRSYDNRIAKANRSRKEELVTALKTIALPIFLISWILNTYYSIISFRQAAIVGYMAIFETSIPAIAKYLMYMFIPSAFLVIVTHKYKKSWFYFVSACFLAYAVPLMITGDRGSWIYFLGPWLWIYIRFVNVPSGDNDKMARRRTFFSILIVAALLFFASVFVSVRDVGYSALTREAFSFKDIYTPFVKPVFEMGQSARILGIIIQDGLDKTYSFGNTYIADILGMVLPSFKTLFGFPDFYVENWMSSNYLGMVNYGVGFSAFGEAYLNGGVFFSWFYMLIYGFFIGRLVNIRNRDVHNNPLATFIALSATAVLGPSVRATLDLWLREFFWGVIFIILVSYGIAAINKKDRGYHVSHEKN